MSKNVPDPQGVPAWHVLGAGEVRTYVCREAEPLGRDKGADDRRGACHVGFHGQHAAVGLEREAARIESDALADKRNMLGRRFAALELDEYGRIATSSADGD